MVSFSPLPRRGFNTYTRSSAEGTRTRGWGGGVGQSDSIELINWLSNKLIYSYSIIYDVIKCNVINDECDDHADVAIRREAHRPMEHIGGFM